MSECKRLSTLARGRRSRRPLADADPCEARVCKGTLTMDTNALAGHLLALHIAGKVLQWAEPCLRGASQAASGTFYQNMPLLCLDALRSLRAVLPSEPQSA